MEQPSRSLVAKVLFFALLIYFFLPSLAMSQDVLTQHNDPGRTGQNLQETILNTSNVNVNGFGKLFTRSVDGQIYAQPLYVSNLSVGGTPRNVVFVATMHNSVYAFDADDPAAGTPLWQVNLGPSVPATDICPTCGYVDIINEIGILSTPVIDSASSTLFVVAKTKTAASSYHFTLHALDLATGSEKVTPVEITGQVNGTGSGSSGGKVSFVPLQHLNRPGLLLANGVVYVAFGSVGDIGNYHGWVFAYNASTLQQVDIFNVSPNGSAGAIWQSGQGLAADAAGNLYFMTGNGTFNANTGGSEYGDTFLKLNPAPGFTVLDYFTPYNQATLDLNDTDLGSGGPMLIPGSKYLVGLGKDAILRLIDTSNMGKFNANSNQDVQEFQALSGGTANSSNPVYWNSPNNGPVLYLWGQNDYLKAYKFNGSSFQTTPVLQGTVKQTAGYSNAAPMSLSANGSQAGTGIIWAAGAYIQDANHQTTGGILRAVDAATLTELWNSKQNVVRDDVGNFAKFSPPTVANGKVYLATFSNQLAVYGLNPPAVGGWPAPWQLQDIGSVGVTGSSSYSGGTYTLTGSGSDIYGTADSFRYGYQSLNGDGQIVARVASLQNTSSYAKAGVMIRETLSAGSTQATMDVTPGNGAEFSRRTTTAGSTTVTTVAGITAPYWVKLTRSGTTFTGYISADGVTWSTVGTATIPMATSVYVGLVVTSHSNSTLSTATYDSVSVTGSGTTTPAVAITAPTNGASFTAPANITITATASGGNGNAVKQVDFYQGTTLLGSSTSAPYSFAWNNVAAGSYALTAKVTDLAGATATSSAVNISVGSTALPSPWATQDVGSVGVAGSATFAGGVFSLQGSGTDIWSTADAFRFVYQPLNGDGQIVARVASLQNTNGFAKGGVMIREALTANSRHAMMVVTPSNGAEFSRRTATGGSTTVTALAGVAAPYWVKLVRSGNTLTGSVSTDGVTWRQVGTSTVTMAAAVYIGLVDNSHNNSVLCSASIDSVSVTGGSTTAPTVAISSPANGASFSAPASIPITATASAANGVAKVDFYAGTTLIGTATSSPYTVTWNNVAAGGYSLTATVTDAVGATATSAPVTVSVTNSGLPAPWATQDVGSVAAAGSAAFAGSTFTVSGSGTDIWGTADSFRFVYKTLTGDGQIIARVASLQNTSTWAKAGVMIRQALTANSVHAMMDVTPGNGAEFSRRTTTGSSTTVTARAGIAAPYWVKLVRSGNTLTGSISTDGITWSQVGSSTVTMTGTVYVGLVVTSHNNGTLATATFDSVQ